MALGSGDRVRVSGTTGYEGTVSSHVSDGWVYVRLDQGSSGTFAVADLIPLAGETKTWPPEGIETK